MAESASRENLSPLEEQYIREQEQEGDADEILAFEKDVAAQRLWQSFQESATAVAHLFRDCQQRAGLSSWVPFHESASAVTQLYRDSAEVCRQCVDCGVRYGHKKRTRDVLSWAKKRKRFIKREDLIAFLLNKPETTPTECHHTTATMKMEDITSCESPSSMNVSSPRRRLICREEVSLPNSGGVGGCDDSFNNKDVSRKRQFNLDTFGGLNISNNNTSTEFGPPITKRIKF